MTEIIVSQLIVHQYIKSFRQYEKFLVLFNTPPYLVLQKKTNFLDPLQEIQHIQTKKFLLDESTKQFSIPEDIQTQYRIREIYQQYDNIMIFTNILLQENTKQINKNLQIIKENWILKLAFSTQYKGAQILLQLNYTTQELMNSRQASSKQTKEIIEQHYQNGNLRYLFEYAQFTDIMIIDVPIIRNEIQTNITYDNKVINNLIAILNFQDVSEVNIMQFLNNKVYQKQQRCNNIKQLLKNPIQVSNKIINTSNKWLNYILQPKLDGIRCLLIIYENTAYLLFEQGFTKLLKTPDELGIYVFEAELYENGIYLYDMHYANSSIIHQNYLIRLEQIKQHMDLIQQKVMIHTNYQLILKQYAYINKSISNDDIKLAESFQNIMKQDFPLDGLILNSNQPYFDSSIYKWKPIEKLTIDFTSKKIAFEQLHLPGQKDENAVYYGLFCLLNPSEFRNFQLENPLRIYFKDTEPLLIFQDPLLKTVAYLKRSLEEEAILSLENKVCECTYNIQEERWQLYRVRQDKNVFSSQYGNYFTIARQIFDTIIQPIYFEDMFIQKTSYFQIKHSNQYSQMVRFINLVKYAVIQSVCLTEKSVIDLASGQGQDLFKYIKTGVKTLMCIDSDQQSLVSLENRFKAYLQQMESSNILVHTKQLDLKNKMVSEYLTKATQSMKSTFVNCNLAIHYFLDNMLLFSEFFNKFRGIVSFSFFNGQKIFNLLQKNPDIQLKQDDKIIYHYQKNYEGNKLLDMGMKIMIKLPFTYSLIEEQIFSPNYLENLMMSNGYKCIQKYDMDGQNTSGYLFTQKQIDQLSSEFSNLNENDKFHVSLYSIYVFQHENFAFKANNKLDTEPLDDYEIKQQ